MSNIVEIDGSYLEGGGQVLRNALSLSCILRKPIRVVNVRANRPIPGLSPQHLYTLNLLRDMTNARVVGNEIHSTTIEFEPGEIKSGNYEVDSRTAASVTLIYQSALPVMLFGEKGSQLKVCGGTNVAMAPQIEFMTEILGPNLEKFGVSFDFELLQRGYYPRGGGQCVIAVTPISELRSINLTHFGEMTEIIGWSFVAGRIPRSVAYDMQHTAQRELHRLWPNLPVKIEVYRESAEMARDNGTGIILSGVTTGGCVLGASAMGEKRADGHVLGSGVAREFCAYIKEGLCVDCHVQDQILIYMALANGVSRILTSALTSHTRTAIHVIESLADVKFDVKYTESGYIILSCAGLGIQNPHLK